MGCAASVEGHAPPNTRKDGKCEMPFQHAPPDTSKVTHWETVRLTAAHRISRLDTCYLLLSSLDPERAEGEEKDTNGNPPLVEWVFFNDSKKWRVRVVVTFPRANGVTVGSERVCAEHLEKGGLRASVDLEPLETVQFVRGAVGGYLWKFEESRVGK